jgi:branched-chain amino acid transport system permease protein
MAAVFGGFAILCAIPPLISDSYVQNMLVMIFLLAIMASSWNIMGGYTGYVSLGQSAFLGVGAYVTAILANHFSVSPFLAAPAGGVAAGLLAALLGLTTIRARGIAFVIVTFAMLMLLGTVALNWTPMTNGSHGMSLPIPAWDPDYANWPFYYVLLGLLCLTLLLSWAIRSSKFGVGLLAIRDDEEKAAGLGINAGVYKIGSFVASSVPIGIAGGIYGYYLTFLDPRSMFTIVTSMMLVLAALLGGVGTLWGPVVGAFLVEPLAELTNQQFTGPEAGGWRLVIFGGALLLVVLLLPQGIVPAVGKLVRKRRSRAMVGQRLVEISADGIAAVPAAPSWLVRERTPAAGLSTEPMLQISALSKRFTGLHVLNGCELDVRRGSITGLIGPNGSGKTTLFNLVDGGLLADGGEIRLGGTRIDGLRRWERSQRGIGRTYQTTRLFPRLTVQENVVAGVRSLAMSSLLAPAISGAEVVRAGEILDFVGLGRYASGLAGELSYGQQKLVELAQVLMLEPELVLLDEPAGGINPTQIEQLAALIRELNKAGTTFLVVEHNMPFVLDLCETVHVLAGGRRIASGAPDEVQRDELVLDAYLGADYRPVVG